MRTEIILIDPEVLRGVAPVGHGHWLARRLSWLGGEVARLAVIDAVAAAVSAEIRRGLMAGAGLIVVAGGRDPGEGEVALPGIARALGLELSLDEEARRLVVDALGRDGDDTAPGDAMSLARLPVGAAALPNSVGLPPGAWIESGGACAVASLPAAGYDEMAAVFDGAMVERIRERLGGGPLFEVSVPAGERSEAELYPLADEVMSEVPGCYVRPVRVPMGQTARLTLQVAASDTDAEASRRKVEDAVRAVKFRLSLEG